MIKKILCLLLFIIFYLFVSFVAFASYKSIYVELVTDTCVKPLVNYHYLTCSPIIFKVQNREFMIPRHFKTDLASIPRFAWSIMSPAHSGSFRAAIVHDWLYHDGCEFTRYDADIVFYELLKKYGLSNLRSSVMYYFVRWFGSPYYQECRVYG